MPPKGKADKTAKRGGKAAASKASAKAANGAATDEAVDGSANELAKLAMETNRTASGVLTSHKDSRDIKIENYSLSFYSQILIQETTIELNFGRRYALIGPNGSGKSTFLRSLAARDVTIPAHIDIYLLSEEYPPTDMSALEAVQEEANREVKRLEQLMEDILSEDPESQALDDIYERIDALDPATFEVRAAEILHGLGFTPAQMAKKTRDLSGGWRMRVALARALFVRPTLLLLDQPTNHLDLGACVWLEEYLKRYNRILLIISHSQDFMNTVCTNIIELTPKKQLQYYAGNFDTYVQTKFELEVNQMKAYEKQQAEIEHMRNFIRSCGTYANLVRQAKSRQKILDKMEADGLVEKVEKAREFKFFFGCQGKLPPPVLSFTGVDFAYSGKKEDALYLNLDLGIDTDSRVALVGPNGAGKSTLLKLMMGQLSPINGSISRHSALKVCRYSQHAAEQLDMESSAVDVLRKRFPESPQDIQYWRTQIGRFGLTGQSQLCPINQLSDGQRSRIVFCELALSNPNVILFDEPTNALDIETIDSLANAINEFEGGIVLVSHDFRLISQVAEEIWVCENKTVTPWAGTIESYKDKLRKDVIKDMKFL
ncbi:P-loop containing nucleoside triphosphate hydrolase protein, partial [Cladochytrium replicatum]